jgi:hypothetical protein
MRSTEIQDELPFSEPTPKQQAFLARHGLQDGPQMDFYDAIHTIGDYVSARRLCAPTAKQERLLRQHGLWKPGLTRGQAFDLIKTILAGERQRQTTVGKMAEPFD